VDGRRRRRDSVGCKRVDRRRAGCLEAPTLVPVADVTKFAVGESITIGIAPLSDTTTISAIGNGLLTLSTPLNNGHAVGDPVSSTASSGVIYRDLELPQDACTQRVGHFGIASEAALTSGQYDFATGLSPSGHLYSAAQTASFYGAPLISWPTALAAYRYEVEWSAKSYPFVAAGQLMTASTAVVLPSARARGTTGSAASTTTCRPARRCSAGRTRRSSSSPARPSRS
jgi:hypothetical protein